MNNDMYTKEEKYLEKVKQIATKHIEKTNINILKEKEKIFEFKKFIWTESGSMNELEYSDILNEANSRVHKTENQVKKLLKYEKICDSAYFGRIDFKTQEETYNVYIGTYGLLENNKNYIFDWRAPISSLFYDNIIGKAEYEAPMGKIKGEITLRRQYKIEEGRIKRIIESDINIDDDILQEILSSNSSEKMKNIVTTIQKEQNEVIRNTKDKCLIVQGVAGSGKTSVALHRIAYLLYKEKELNYNNILIFSPNNIFSEYISSVLPELGEENVLNTTFNELVKKYLNNEKTEDFSSFLERKYESNTMVKNQDELKSKLDEFIKYYSSNYIFTKDFIINNMSINRFELNNLLIKKYEKLPYFERIKNLTEYICNRLNVSYKINKNKIYKKIINDLKIETNPISIYNMFLEYTNDERKVIGRINYDDLEYIIYLIFELNGYPYNTKVRHVVVDEAQDYSKLQFSILEKIFPYAYFTILGDVNQSINPDNNYSSLKEIAEIFKTNPKFVELNKTYRSSEEIINFTNQILNINNASAVRKSNGFNVNVKNVKKIEEITDDINYLRKNKMKTIAVITKNMKETNKIYNKLNKNTQFSVIKNSIKKDHVSILPSYAAKGLEFDAVISYNDIDNKYSENEKKLFYVVCTRAQHMLIVYNK